MTDARAILLDIEGTTTPIEFVHQVLFPYARARVHAYLDQHADDPGVRADVALLRAEYAAESTDSPDLPPWNPELQGRIWEDGYRAGELRGKGAVYPDVRPALERWHAAGRTIAIFSSGSIRAQRNLFANTTAGDLSPFVSDYFDTTTGPKREAGSYRRIAAALRQPPNAVLFVSDVSAELDAARAAAMRTALCVRGTPAPGEIPTDHPRIHSFAELA